MSLYQVPSESSDFSFDVTQGSLLLSALANPQRLAVMRLLLDGEWDVGGLAIKIGLSQSALSQHLRRLRDARLVSTRREAQSIFYSSASVEALRIIEILDTLAGDGNGASG